MHRWLIAAICLLATSTARAQDGSDAGTPPAPPAPAGPAPASPPSDGTAPAAPPPDGSPPPGYYVEPGAAQPPAKSAPATSPATSPSTTYEPPPPGYGPVYEPPPPPIPRHIAPKSAFWLGARLGWFLPFGSVLARGTAQGGYIIYDSIPWSDYASSGPMFEVDAGLRIARNYNLFGMWERAQLGAGDALNDVSGGQTGGDTDMFGIGLRARSDADKVGFLTEIALGYRRARATWQDGTELQFTDGILEGRIGLGADIRLGPAFSLSPLLTLGVGSFGDIEWKAPNGSKVDAFGPNDQADGHAWLTLQIGGHFDIGGSN
ncbi:MAG TPA: hypothetical protein VGP93_08140 [Polyangiaceae bacterium]|nr:hypothetical protein [Polyangiaceae bacterium]